MIYAAKVIRNGGSQAVRLPKQLRTVRKVVYVQRVGTVLVISDTKEPWAGLRNSSGKIPGIKRPRLRHGRLDNGSR